MVPRSSIGCGRSLVAHSIRSPASRPGQKGILRCVRIAFAGSHRVGKSTLVERVVEALPGYTAVDEPYYLLEEEGYECSDPPSIEDCEAQLDRSWLALEDNAANVLFDRCPADVLASLLVPDDAPLVGAASATERAREAMTSLDLIVFVPI